MIDLPTGWEKTTLGEAFKITLGQSPSSTSYNKNKKGLPFFQGKLEFGDFYPSVRKWCSAPKKIADKDSVLISVRAPVGPTNLAPEKCCIGRGLAAIESIYTQNPRFILYQLRSIEPKLNAKGTGTTFSAITGAELKKTPFLFPPLPEQQRIVAKIEELFTKLDAGMEALNRIQGYNTKPIKGKALQLRQSILKRAFEGKLVPQDPNDEPASILLERIKAENNKQ